jgi:PAT family beta-lactamase induction signal transducer AmpG|tara:strand:- start:596 stop:2131 length:1536 start_codon:yes stop_codon:yes gene_type:complete
MINWQQSIRAFLHPRVITMLFFGFSAGIPLALVFGTLGIWLREAGIDRVAVTFFSWAALGYSFKFVWAPIVDFLPLPFLDKYLGRRRSWILVSQISIILSILLMCIIDPAAGNTQLTIMALAAVALGFSSATQDIVIDAYRIESASIKFQALMSSTYIAGYRIGMIISGAGSLLIASYFGSEMNSYDYEAWQITYFIMSFFMLIGVATTLIINEPKENKIIKRKYTNYTYIKFFIIFLIAIFCFIGVFLSSSDISTYLKNILTEILNNRNFSNFLIELLRLFFALLIASLITTLSIKIKFIEKKVFVESYVSPIVDFFQRYGIKLALFLLILIGLYRISDIVLGVISNIFYLDIGFSKEEIATIVKIYGPAMTIVGGFLGGILSLKYGVLRILYLGAFLTVATNLLFMLLSTHENHSLLLLSFVISADNLSAGIASAAFVAFLSRLTNISFTAMQYAIFSSLMTLIPKILGGYSGSIVENIGYTNFFLFASLLGVPVLLVIFYINKYLKFD